ncbi:NAD-dependent epimerase/dehydratase family protein [Psychroflexus aestuariivivens]|uniref:NAD-dependent epimerase/dehydratase family protein n=1 Tax=Psychroflexus aestuariivivens TaxID=1795040 RepID=UPI000FD9C5EE|nr:NAD-dependent epimerase/dehydratase family protein [Psychroflexus aestuariivivens]
MTSKILIVGACGQIGSELTSKLRETHGAENVIASDIRESNADFMNSGPFEVLDATDFEAFEKICKSHNIKTVYMMAAMLSGTAEKFPMKAWDLNMTSLFNVLDLAKNETIKQVFWPSSIAVFGPTTPKFDTPQQTVMEPTTVYGISKQAGERWCAYYHKRYGVDVRSIRYPGLISYKTPPGGGTTDYAIEIFYDALEKEEYTSFLSKDTALPMMYMDDAIEATISIMKTPAEQIKVRSSYNLGGVSFTPEELGKLVAEEIDGFQMNYDPDFRQAIADSWPSSINDEEAQKDWNWQHKYDLEMIVKAMLEGIRSLENSNSEA